jgi:hypothetical protein
MNKVDERHATGEFKNICSVVIGCFKMKLFYWQLTTSDKKLPSSLMRNKSAANRGVLLQLRQYDVIIGSTMIRLN